MKLSMKLFAALLLAALLGTTVSAQESAQTSAVVPRLVTYSGRAANVQGKPAPGVAGVTFAIYKEQEGGAPLWLETQNVKLDAQGHFTVQLGSTNTSGLPVELFASGEGRWLGIRVNGAEEQARVLLVSVPYALKAADAQTLGGLPASAFMLAGPVGGSTMNPETAGASLTPATAPPPVSGTGTTDFVPLWLNATGGLGNSALFQTGTGSTAKMGINTTTPATVLDVNGAATVRGNLALPTTGNATTTAGKNSQPATFTASAFNSSSSTSVPQSFRWQAEPVGNNTASASASMNLLFGRGSAAPAETGLRVGSNGRITFAPGQTFPGTATSVALTAPASDFTVTGSPVTGAGTLGLGWKVAPTASDVANAIVKRDGTGSFSAGSISASSSSAGGTAVVANAGSSGGTNGLIAYGATGVAGYTTVASSIALYGYAGNTSGSNGVVGYGATGVAGNSTITGSYGTFGNGSTGVWGASNGTGVNVGVSGTASGGTGVSGTGTVGVYGASNAANAGVYATSNGGWALDAYGSSGGTGVLAGSDTGYAAWFNGDVNVDGNLSKNGGSFKIDHPLDPANKYLYHSFVESPDMMNIYNGNAITNASGEAVVTLPEWFETLNRDFRYQLTVMGQFAQAIVASKVANHRFAIKTDKPNVEVSWQVTGIRQDAWANAHRIPVEEVKPQKERGFYQHPELYGAPQEKSILWSRAPQAMKQWKESQAKLAATGQKDTPAKP